MTMTRAIPCLALLVTFGAGCSSDSGTTDSGPAGDVAVDALVPDSGAPDTIAPDTIAPDTIAPDTGTPDGTLADTGVDLPADAGVDLLIDGGDGAIVDDGANADDGATDGAADAVTIDAAGDAVVVDAVTVDGATDAAPADLGPVGDIFPPPPDGLPDGLPATDGPLQGCGPVDFEGCCRGGVLYYCDGAGVLLVADCAASPQCGWDDFYQLYDCGTDGKADPSGTHPQACPF